MARLRELTLRDATGWLDALFQRDHLPALEKLTLVRSNRARVAWLAEWPGLRRLSRIRLPMVDMEAVAGERIAASPHWSDTTRVRAPQRSMAAFRRRLGPRALEDHWPGPPRTRLG